MAIKHIFAGLALCAGLLVGGQSWAQGVCPMGQAAPTIVTGTSFAINGSMECQFLIFTSTTPVAVTTPAPSSLPIHFQITLMSTVAPVTVTPAGGNVNGQANSTPTISPYMPMAMFADGSNYWLTLATPSLMNGPLTNYAATTGLMPGTTIDGSPLLYLGNGILRFSNEASFHKGVAPPWLASNACRGAPPGSQQPGKPWLEILDSLGIPRYIPTC